MTFRFDKNNYNYQRTLYEDYLEECEADWGIEDGKAQPDVEPLTFKDFVAQHIKGEGK
tara:strand:+ start:682 stop:855 length:174 start_codon:yes stop_codon:yes gene_type:complete